MAAMTWTGQHEGNAIVHLRRRLLSQWVGWSTLDGRPTLSDAEGVWLNILIALQAFIFRKQAWFQNAKRRHRFASGRWRGLKCRFRPSEALQPVMHNLHNDGTSSSGGRDGIEVSLTHFLVIDVGFNSVFFSASGGLFWSFWTLLMDTARCPDAYERRTRATYNLRSHAWF